jgi:hypothetical protein
MGVFVSKLLGPAVEEVGFFLEDKVRLYRLKNQIRILAKAQEMLVSAGINPKAIPLRTLLPLLDGASLEDDIELSLKWAGLLASAASGEGKENHPAFPHILGQLSPLDARIIERLDICGGELSHAKFKAETRQELSISEEEYSYSFRNLFRLGLCVSVMRKSTLEEVIILGPFGKNFLKLCRGPIESDKE